MSLQALSLTSRNRMILVTAQLRPLMSMTANLQHAIIASLQDQPTKKVTNELRQQQPCHF